MSIPEYELTEVYQRSINAGYKIQQIYYRLGASETSFAYAAMVKAKLLSEPIRIELERRSRLVLK